MPHPFSTRSRDVNVTLRDKGSYCILLMYLNNKNYSACKESCILSLQTILCKQFLRLEWFRPVIYILLIIYIILVLFLGFLVSEQLLVAWSWAKVTQVLELQFAHDLCSRDRVRDNLWPVSPIQSMSQEIFNLIVPTRISMKQIPYFLLWDSRVKGSHIN